jgi:hypothetical protein
MVDIQGLNLTLKGAAEAERTMPTAAFGELDAAVMYAELTAAEFEADGVVDVLAILRLSLDLLEVARLCEIPT